MLLAFGMLMGLGIFEVDLGTVLGFWDAVGFWDAFRLILGGC